MLLTTEPNLSLSGDGYKQALVLRVAQRNYRGTAAGLPRDDPGYCRCPFPLLQAPRAIIIAEFSEDFLCGQAAVRQMNCAPCRWNAAWSNTPRVPAWLNSATPMCW